ncbi:MAG: hypothetical protein LBE92_15280 [Chryseobacterium sp.]|jgi:hypothetical protein|uniref:hypothetical protein n=1 Tax=Chryseobacterium sp. TaxID=1871047 RepID=UPI002827D30F|nr:hypothetical protein [Chryseobacterium sp.]MDR2237483.1 hypothetical protein [Chryseobacterium sp.]
MENRKGPSIIAIALAVILGAALYREFDSEHMRFKNTGLAVIYFTAFAFYIFTIIKGIINKSR